MKYTWEILQDLPATGYVNNICYFKLEMRCNVYSKCKGCWRGMTADSNKLSWEYSKQETR